MNLQYFSDHGDHDILNLWDPVVFRLYGNVQNQEGRTFLMLAAREGRADVVDRFIEQKDVDVNLQDPGWNHCSYVGNSTWTHRRRTLYCFPTLKSMSICKTRLEPLLLFWQFNMDTSTSYVYCFPTLISMSICRTRMGGLHSTTQFMRTMST